MPNSIREALRVLFRDVRFTAAAVSVLALTLGATTGVYAVVRSIVLQPFPFTDQERVVVIWQRDLRRELPVIEVAYDEMTDWRARTKSFEDLAVVSSVNWSVTLVDGDRSESVPYSAVSASFFTVLGTRPLLGRGFEAHDELGSVLSGMVISHGLWVRRFGRDPRIVGRHVSVRFEAEGAEVPVEILGVMPAPFDFPRGADVWMPAAPLIRNAGTEPEDAGHAMRWLRVFYVLGRLRPEVPLRTVAPELSRIMRTADVGEGAEPPSELVLTPVTRYLLGHAAPVLWALLAGAALMLLIACANIAGLQVSRSIGRQRVLGIRLALGASNGHLVRQAAAESALLIAAGLLGGMVVAVVTTRAIVLMAPSDVPRLLSVRPVEAPVLAFAAALAFLATLMSGVWPALVAARLNPVRALAYGPAVASEPAGRRLQRTMVVAQVAIALILLAGTSLFVRTVAGLNRTVLGFEPHDLFAVSITPPTDDLDRWNAYYEELIARVETLPDVTAAAGVQLRPLSGPIGWDTQPVYPGQNPKDAAATGLNPYVNLEVVTPGFFRTMRIRLLRGRAFDDRDTVDAPGVVIVSESAARRLWPGRDPLGQLLRDQTYREGAPSDSVRWQRVVGIVEDVRYRGLNDVRLDVYLPAAQSTNRVKELMIRASATPATLLESIGTRARELDPNVTVSGLTAMTDAVAAESAPWRFLVRVFITFGAVAAALTATGLAAVIALTVASRRRELAIRAALGAGRARLRATVLREGLWLVGTGSLCGLAGALALGRGADSLLVGVSAHDTVALSVAVLITGALGICACWLPARRAADADPIEALKAE